MSSPNIPQDSMFWLYADNYRTYNIDVARKLQSINAAILLSELASRHRYHSLKNELTTDAKHGAGWFYYTQESIEERTCLTRYNQESAIEILVNAGLIEKRVLGIPGKRHFRVNIQAIHVFFFGGVSQTSLVENHKQECGNPPNSDDGKPQTGHIIEEPYLEPNNNLTHSATVVADESIDSSSPAKIEKPKEPLSPEAKKLQIEIEALMKSKEPTWNPPKSHFLAHQCDILLRDGATYQSILDVVLWALEDEFWASALFTPKSNPGTVLRKRFAQWRVRMNVKPKAKAFGNAKVDSETSRKARESFMEGFINANDN